MKETVIKTASGRKPCDICGAQVTLLIDCPTIQGPWGHLCTTCHGIHGLDTSVNTRILVEKLEGVDA